MIVRCRRALGVAALSLSALFTTTQLCAADEKPAMTPPTASGKLSFHRLYTSPDGNSHFADETIELTPLNGAGPEAHLSASRLGDVQGAMILSLKAGATEPYHIAPRRQIMFCLRGIVEVTAGDGTKRRVLPGQFVLLEDTSGKGHITHAVGNEDHVALAFPIADDVLARK